MLAARAQALHLGRQEPWAGAQAATSPQQLTPRLAWGFPSLNPCRVPGEGPSDS